MNTRKQRSLALPVCWGFALCACIPLAACGAADQSATTANGNIVAFTGATVWDGTGSDPIPEATIVVRDGWIETVGQASEVEVPDGARVESLAGLFVTPGLINTHGHVGGTMEPTAEMSGGEIVEAELQRYARFGVTAVNSLGGEGEAAAARRFALEPAPDGPAKARLLVAGEVVAGDTEEALAATDRNIALGIDWIKIRVDDNLGTTTKMPPETYRAVIDRAHQNDRPLAAHLFYLDDAKDLLSSGADLIAHSIRDQPVDDEVADLFLQHNVCLVPTLTREVSTFVYGSRPDFMDDPFLTSDVDSAQVKRVLDPVYQQRVAASPAAAAYRTALEVAQQNLKTLSDAGVRIGFGTDTGPLGRFQGYFEHLELELMAEAGLTPEQVLLSATRDAASCAGFQTIGTLESGKWADFVAYRENPLNSVEQSRTIERVFVGGREVDRTPQVRGIEQ